MSSLSSYPHGSGTNIHDDYYDNSTESFAVSSESIGNEDAVENSYDQNKNNHNHSNNETYHHDIKSNINDPPSPNISSSSPSTDYFSSFVPSFSALSISPNANDNENIHSHSSTFITSTDYSHHEENKSLTPITPSPSHPPSRRHSQKKNPNSSNSNSLPPIRSSSSTSKSTSLIPYSLSSSSSLNSDSSKMDILQVELRAVDHLLSTKQREYKEKMSQMSSRELLFKSKVEETKKFMDKFQHFVNETDTKRQRAERREAEERKQKENKVSEYLQLQQYLQELHHKKEKLTESLTILMKFKFYLDLVVTSSDHQFNDIEELIGRFYTLQSNYNELKKTHLSLSQTTENLQNDINNNNKKISNEILMQNSLYAKLIKELEEITVKNTIREGEMGEERGKREESTREIIAVQSAISNIYGRAKGSVRSRGGKGGVSVSNNAVSSVGSTSPLPSPTSNDNHHFPSSPSDNQQISSPRSPRSFPLTSIPSSSSPSPSPLDIFSPSNETLSQLSFIGQRIEYLREIILDVKERSGRERERERERKENKNQSNNQNHHGNINTQSGGGGGGGGVTWKGHSSSSSPSAHLSLSSPSHHNNPNPHHHSSSLSSPALQFSSPLSSMSSSSSSSTFWGNPNNGLASPTHSQQKGNGNGIWNGKGKQL